MIGWLLTAGLILVGFVLYKAWPGLVSRRRSGPENNWVNEAYAARREARSWSESDRATGSGTAPTFVNDLSSSEAAE